MKRFSPNVWSLSLGIVNVGLVRTPDGLVLIDTGTSGSGARILSRLADRGHGPTDIRHVLLTHVHYDHVGGVGDIKKYSGAKVHMHKADAGLLRAGIGGRPLVPGPGVVSKLVGSSLMKGDAGRVEACVVDHEIIREGSEGLPPGFSAIFTPGHTAGHISFLYEPEKVLFVGDAATNIFGLGHPFVFEDPDEAVRSERKLGTVDFEIALFGHGRALTRKGPRAFQRRFGAV